MNRGQEHRMNDGLATRMLDSWRERLSKRSSDVTGAEARAWMHGGERIVLDDLVNEAAYLRVV